MRSLFIILSLAVLYPLWGQDYWIAHMDSLVQIEWDWMSKDQREVVLTAYEWGAERGYRELGAHYAVESRGKMYVLRLESNGDECAGAGQNNVRHATIRTYAENYTPLQYATTRKRLCSNLTYNLEQSWEHIKIGMIICDTQWSVYRWYNNIEAENDAYAAWIMAWTRFLDRIIANPNNNGKGK